MPKGFLRKMRDSINALRNKMDVLIREDKKAHMEARQKLKLAEFTKGKENLLLKNIILCIIIFKNHIELF